MTNYYIIGFHKCGTTSLEQYLKSKGHNVLRKETAFEDIPEWVLNSSDKQLAVIIRDPVERTYSHYNYKKYHQKGDVREINESFEAALIQHPELIEHSQYDKYIKMFPNIEIFVFEEMIKLPDFPKLTVSEYKEPLTDERRKAIEDML